MKIFNFKTKHLLPILVVTITCMFSLSSCKILLNALADKRPAAEKTFEICGYHFAAESPTGQMLCYKYVDSLNVSCVTPKFYVTDTTAMNVIYYKLSGNVIIPKTVSDGKKTYNVVSLGYVELMEYSSSSGQYEKFISSWGNDSCDIKALVIPPSMRLDRARLYLGNVKNIIAYGSKEDYDNNRLYKEIVYFGQNKDCWVHVPRGSYKVNYKNGYKFIEIVNDYNIYEQGHTLDEYLKISKPEIDQAIMMKKLDYTYRRDDSWIPNFAVGNLEGVIWYYRIMDEAKKEVRLCEVLDSKTGYTSWATIAIPSQVTYRNELYTVTSASVESNVVAIPETCKSYNVRSSDEIICYSPDIEFYQNRLKVLHVPHGCVKKYIGSVESACLEIVDNYSVYEQGHSIKQYLDMSREAVENAKAAKIKAEEDAKLAKQKKNEAEEKAYRQELTKKYGAKYVNALYDKGQITIGMPIELFDVGLDKQLFKNPRIDNVYLEAKTANGVCFRMTAINYNTLGTYFVGYVWFIDDKVSAVSY